MARHTRQLWYAVLATCAIAPVAVVSGMLAAHFAQPDDQFAIALGTTTVFGFAAGALAASIARRRTRWLRPADSPARVHRAGRA